MMKARVPSMGSMIHLRPFADSRLAPSSPSNPSSGNARCNSSTISFSHSRSAIVTGDFIGNGSTDLAISLTGPDDVQVQLSNDNGTFSSPSLVDLVRRETPVVADMTGDGASDVIVVGRAGQISSQPNNHRVVFLVSVDRVMKGSAPYRLPVALDLSASSGYGAVGERQYGVFFLRWRPGDSAYAATDPFHPMFFASPQRGQASLRPATASGGTGTKALQYGQTTVPAGGIGKTPLLSLLGGRWEVSSAVRTAS